MIIAPAIACGNIVFAGKKSHSGCKHEYRDKFGEPDDWFEDGFITDTGEFLNRVDALLHFLECKQTVCFPPPVGALNCGDIHSDDLDLELARTLAEKNTESKANFTSERHDPTHIREIMDFTSKKQREFIPVRDVGNNKGD